MSKKIPTIKTKEMLKEIAKVILEDAEARKNRLTDPIWSDLLIHGYMSFHPLFAQDGKGIVIQLVCSDRSGKILFETCQFGFAFNEEQCEKLKERIPMIDPNIAKRDSKWFEKIIFYVNDYKENRKIVSILCADIKWLNVHLAADDLEGFFNRKHYEKILKQAEEWVNN